MKRKYFAIGLVAAIALASCGQLSSKDCLSLGQTKYSQMSETLTQFDTEIINSCDRAFEKISTEISLRSAANDELNSVALGITKLDPKQKLRVSGVFDKPKLSEIASEVLKVKDKS